MILDNVNRKIQVVLTGAKTTLDMPITVDYIDTTPISTKSGLISTTTNGVTTVDVVPAPDAHIERKIRSLTVYNKDTAAKTIQIFISDNGVQYQVQDVTLQVDDVLMFTELHGWSMIDGNGNKKTTSTISGLLSTSPSTGIGYATGAGGAVVQITNRSTGVTLNNVCGTIQTDTTSLAAGASAVFTVTNSRVAIGDVVILSQRSGSSNAAGVAGTTFANVVAVANGSFNIAIDNKSTTTAETGAIILNFAIIKAVSL
jgi:hypothetical protein